MPTPPITLPDNTTNQAQTVARRWSPMQWLKEQHHELAWLWDRLNAEGLTWEERICDYGVDLIVGVQVFRCPQCQTSVSETLTIQDGDAHLADHADCHQQVEAWIARCHRAMASATACAVCALTDGSRSPTNQGG